MFGSAPRHGDQTGQPPSGQDNTRFILDKIEELDKRLTRQMTCKHGPFKYEDVSSGYGAIYRKVCTNCRLVFGTATYREKLDGELEQAKAEVQRLQEAISMYDERASE